MSNMSYTTCILCAVMAVFVSCSAPTEHRLTEIAGADTVKLRYASGFRIVKTPNSTLVTVFNPWAKGQIFAQYTIGGSEKRIKAVTDQQMSHIPRRLGISSSTAVGYLTLLGSQNLVAGMCDGELVYDTALYRRFASGKLPSLGRQMVDSYESIINAELDGYVKSGFEQSPAQDERYISAGLPIIYLNDWTENHPLARAEWIKFIACFTGQSQKADSIFAQIEARYLAAKNIAQQFTDEPTVLAGGAFKGEWYVPGGQSYFAHLIKDAHGTYPWAADTSVGSVTLSFETVFSNSADADFWLSSQDFTPRQLVETDSRLAHFRSLKNNTLYTYNKRLGLGGGNDYWESGVCRPDLILEDIIHILHRGGNRDSLYFFSQLTNMNGQNSASK